MASFEGAPLEVYDNVHLTSKADASDDHASNRTEQS